MTKKYGFDTEHIIRNKAWIDPNYVRLIKPYINQFTKQRTWGDIKEIRELWLAGRHTMKMMNMKYGGDVSDICYNRSWIDSTYTVPIKKRRKESGVQANITP